MLDEECHWTGPAPPLQVSVMLYRLAMAVRLGAEHFWLGVSDCHVWPTLFAQTLTCRRTGLPMDGVTVEVICHSPGWNWMLGVWAWATGRRMNERDAMRHGRKGFISPCRLSQELRLGKLRRGKDLLAPESGQSLSLPSRWISTGRVIFSASLARPSGGSVLDRESYRQGAIVWLSGSRGAILTSRRHSSFSGSRSRGGFLEQTAFCEEQSGRVCPNRGG